MAFQEKPLCSTHYTVPYIIILAGFVGQLSCLTDLEAVRVSACAPGIEAVLLAPVLRAKERSSAVAQRNERRLLATVCRKTYSYSTSVVEGSGACVAGKVANMLTGIHAPPTSPVHVTVHLVPGYVSQLELLLSCVHLHALAQGNLQSAVLWLGPCLTVGCLHTASLRLAQPGLEVDLALHGMRSAMHCNSLAVF
jgi:hypothetical protein